VTLHPLGLAKRRLFKQVWACAKAGSAGTEAHLSAIKAFHAAAWECFAARRCDPPQRLTEYVLRTRLAGDTHPRPLPAPRQRATVDARTKKAILALERDCEFCWQELNRAIDAWNDGSRPKIRSIEALSKWRRDYEKRWSVWLARGNKKLPTNLKRMAEFAESNGQVCMIAGDGEGKLFANAKEAQRYLQRTEKYQEQQQVQDWYTSDTNQKLIAMFDKATAENDPTIWQQLEKAFKTEENTDANDDE
jgi:hypothetical protein